MKRTRITEAQVLHGALEVCTERCEDAERAMDGARKERDAARLEFATVVRRSRIASGMTLRDCAKRCNVSASFLSDFELGRRWSDTLVADLLRILK